jgi:DNA-directed RNA polymerase subunit M/transcription elongation factor TFIIS
MSTETETETECNQTDTETECNETEAEADVGVVEGLDRFIPKHPYREKIYNKFLNLFKKLNYTDLTDTDLQKMALNIERGCFNQTLCQASLHQKDSWNSEFQTKYSSKVVRIYTNLNPDSYLKNTNLFKRLFRKEFTEFELVSFTQEQIFPERFIQIQKEYDALQPKIIKKEEVPDGVFTCGRCKSKKTTYYQLQTRSAEHIGQKSILPLTYWLCYWKNSCNPIAILFIIFARFRC